MHLTAFRFGKPYESLERNKGKQEKEKLIASFHLLGQNHPLVNEYRKKMAQILF